MVFPPLSGLLSVVPELTAESSAQTRTRQRGVPASPEPETELRLGPERVTGRRQAAPEDERQRARCVFRTRLHGAGETQHREGSQALLLWEEVLRATGKAPGVPQGEPPVRRRRRDEGAPGGLREAEQGRLRRDDRPAR